MRHCRPGLQMPARHTKNSPLSVAVRTEEGGRLGTVCLSAQYGRDWQLWAWQLLTPHLRILPVLTGLSDPRNLQEHMQEINLNIYFNGVRTDSQKITFKQFFSIFTLAKV